MCTLPKRIDLWAFNFLQDLGSICICSCGLDAILGAETRQEQRSESTVQEKYAILDNEVRAFTLLGKYLLALSVTYMLLL